MIQNDYVYFGHHRCGTTWIRDVIRKVCNIKNINYYVLGGTASNHSNSENASKQFKCFVNANCNDIEKICKNDKSFHVIRDPRDALISDYWSRKVSHSITSKEKETLRAILVDKNIEDGLIHMLDHTTYFAQIKNWPIGENKKILEVKYEDLLQDELLGFTGIFNFLNLEIDSQVLQEIVTQCSFETLTKRQKGEEKKDQHRRKAMAGDWKNYFRKYPKLHEKANEKIKDLVIKLGYEL